MKAILKKELESKKSNIKTMKISNTGMSGMMDKPIAMPMRNMPMNETPVFHKPK